MAFPFPSESCSAVLAVTIGLAACPPAAPVRDRREDRNQGRL